MDQKIYFQSNRTPTLWFVTLICLSMSVLGTAATLNMTVEEDLYDYSSITSMRLWQAFFLMMSNALTVVMWWMSGKYVLRITRYRDGQLQIRTWSMFLISRTFHLREEDIVREAIKHYEGRTFIPGKPLVHAPWDSVHTQQGRRFVVDLQGSFPEGYDRYYSILQSGKK